jgi:integrase
MARKWLPDHVTAYTDRHGKKRYRFRRAGYRTHHFKSSPGTEEFRAEYHACKGLEIDAEASGLVKASPGSFDELIVAYYRSSQFLNTGERTQVVYRGVLDRWRETRTKSGMRYGSAYVRDLTAARVDDMMAAMLPHRTAANMLRKRLSALMDFAVIRGKATGNPVRSIKALKVDSQGFHTWTEDEISSFEGIHPVGTRARLAFDLLLWTGQRGGDVRLLGPGLVKHGRLILSQEKTDAALSLPILRPLAESLATAPTGTETFIARINGQPFSRKGFGNWFRTQCDQVGLKHCSAHGLRKAAARRLAEAGCSNQQIKAWTGHSTDSEVARYTAAASQVALSDDAADRLMANLKKRNGEPDDKQFK